MPNGHCGDDRARHDRRRGTLPRAGMDDYLSKPLDKAELLAIIEDVPQCGQSVHLHRSEIDLLIQHAEAFEQLRLLHFSLKMVAVFGFEMGPVIAKNDHAADDGQALVVADGRQAIVHRAPGYYSPPTSSGRRGYAGNGLR
jgi:hypothetical protein